MRIKLRSKESTNVFSIRQIDKRIAQLIVLKKKKKNNEFLARQRAKDASVTNLINELIRSMSETYEC